MNNQENECIFQKINEYLSLNIPEKQWIIGINSACDPSSNTQCRDYKRCGMSELLEQKLLHMLGIVIWSVPLHLALHISGSSLWKQGMSTINSKLQNDTQASWDIKQDTSQNIAREIDFDTNRDITPKHHVGKNGIPTRQLFHQSERPSAWC